jgi:hypothetical protein
MKSRLLLFVVVAAALLLSIGASCHRMVMPPVFVSATDAVFAGDTARLRLVTIVRGYQSIGYIIDWGDTVETNSGPFPLGDTATVSHVWSTPGVKQVRVRAFPNAYPDRLSDCSQPETVRVLAGGEHAPVIDTFFFGPPVAVRGVAGFFTARAHDPDGDSIRFHVDWGDSSDTTTAFDSSPCSIFVGHVYTSVGTFTAIAEAEDVHGACSEPESISIVVGTAGGVIWFQLGRCWTSALVASDGSEECVYCSVEEYPGDEPHLRAIDVAGQVKHTYGGTTTLTDEPACCAATGHIIVGGAGGEFHALEMNLDEAWKWPTGTWQRWGPMAISGPRMYLKTNYDSIHYFIDSITSGAHVAAFEPIGHQTGAPVIDAQGNVYFGTDSGYLYKMGPELDTVFWRTRLLANGEIHSPIIGSDGTVYCASDSSRVYAVDAVTGIPLWTVTLDGEPFRLALGQTALFIGSSFGKVYSISPATGSINWERLLSPTDGFLTTPIVAANGYVYFQNDADVLFCVNQPDGTLIWSCDCKRYLPRTGGNSHRPRNLQLTDYPPNPTILANGNIIVAGDDALYCVAGYPEGPLDPLAPWPKWQHDVYNSGYVGGGK